MLDADDVGERSLPIVEVSPDSLAAVVDAGTATMNGVLGFATLTTLMLRTTAGRYWSLLLAQIKSFALRVLLCFSVKSPSPISYRELPDMDSNHE